MKLIYSRGQPYGAPAFYLRGGATKVLKPFLKEKGFIWDQQKFCWTTYMLRDECVAFLAEVRLNYPEIEVVPKKGNEVL